MQHWLAAAWLLPPSADTMAALCSLLALSAAGGAAASAPKPHVLFFLADDYGHYDISYNNPKAPTPTLHALATEGVILNRHCG